MPSIEFAKDTLGNILQAKKNLRVPVNQRTYAWRKEDVEHLCTYLNGAITNGCDEYFLGSIVALGSKSVDFIEVHDGQQCLATTMILVAAIRDYFFNANDREIAFFTPSGNSAGGDSTVDSIGVQPAERALACCKRAFSRDVSREDFGHQENVVAPVEVASATHSSAVSIWVMPRSSPRRKAAMADLRSS
jgi:hypothetical protein